MSTASREWAWLKATARKVPRGWRRVMATIVSAAAVIVGAATPAWAASNVPAALSWIGLTDSRGISVWAYGLSLDTGGITSPSKVVWSAITGMLWQTYRTIVVFAIWFIDWVMSFGWLGWISTPVSAVSDSLHSVVNQMGLAPLFLTILAAVAGVAIIRGRFALGLFEILMGCVVASLALGGLANPVGLVTGNSGYIMQARNLGIEISAGLANNGNTTGSPDQLRTEIGKTLVDTFVRTPHALVNYGQPIAGNSCESAYDDALRNSAQQDDGDYVRNKVGDCSKAMGDYAAHPNDGMAMSAAVLTPAALLVLGFALLLCGSLFMAAARVLFESLKLVVTLITGILPGAGRGSLWQGVGNLVMALATMTFTIVFLSGYLLVLQAVFGNSGKGGTPVMATFVLVDVLIVVGALLFWRARKRLQDAAARLAGLLSTRPGGGGPSKLPAAPQGRGLAAAQSLVQNRLMSRSLRAGRTEENTGEGAGSGKWAAAGAAGSTSTKMFTRLVNKPRPGADNPSPAANPSPNPSPGGRPGPAGNPDADPLPTPGPDGRPTPPPRAGAAAAEKPSPALVLGRQLAISRVKKTAKGVLVRAALHTAAAVSSGGLSTVVTAADAARTAQQVNNARRAIVAARLTKAAALGKGSPPAPGKGSAAAPTRGSVMPPSASAGYEQVHKSGQTILVPPRPPRAGVGTGSQLPPRPSSPAAARTQSASRPTSPAPRSTSTSSRPAPPSTPTTSTPPSPARPTPRPRPTPPQPAPHRPAGPATQSSPAAVPASSTESAEQLHENLRAYRSTRRPRIDA